MVIIINFLKYYDINISNIYKIPSQFFENFWNNLADIVIDLFFYKIYSFYRGDISYLSSEE